jgi:hypothetical protein
MKRTIRHAVPPLVLQLMFPVLCSWYVGGSEAHEHEGLVGMYNNVYALPNSWIDERQVRRAAAFLRDFRHSNALIAIASTCKQASFTSES